MALELRILWRKQKKRTKRLSKEGAVFIVGGGNSVIKMIPEEIVMVTIAGVKK